jgi:hypothetical protein
MRQTLIETQLFELSPQSLTEAKTSERGNLLVSGRLQAAQTKNGNGRYYPKEILQREVENYKKGPVKENRAQEVQDDFELLCFDFVSTPSTPGAYMHTIKEGLDSLVFKPNKYSRVNEVITEILCNNGQCPII